MPCDVLQYEQQRKDMMAGFMQDKACVSLDVDKQKQE